MRPEPEPKHEQEVWLEAFLWLSSKTEKGYVFYLAAFIILSRLGSSAEVMKSHYSSTYGVLCYNTCDKHGKDYYWCKTRKGWDYCSPAQNRDYKDNACRDDHPCDKHDKDYYWCYKNEGWGYCGTVESKTTTYLSSKYQRLCNDECLYDESSKYYWCYTDKGWDYCSPSENIDYKGNACRDDHPCDKHAFMMEWPKVLWCISLLCIGAAVSDIQTLQDIKDLKGLEFGHEYPRHGLLLLHWLANHASMDQAEGIRLHFNPVRKDYGFQPYKNPQCTRQMGLPNLDDSPDSGYYSVGSLSSEAARTQLLPYVTQDYYNALDNPKRDLDRIVVRVPKSSPMRADKVYITSVQGCDYDQNKTHEISPKLLRQILALQKPVNMLHVLMSDVFGNFNSSMMGSDDPRPGLSRDELITYVQHYKKLLQSIYEQPGLSWLLCLAGYDVDARYDVHKQTWLCSADEPAQEDPDPETACGSQRPVRIEVKSSQEGYAKLEWSGIPRNIMQQDPVIILFSSDTSNKLQTFESLKGRASGSATTFVSLNHGLQPRLVTYDYGTGDGFIGLRYSVFWRGPQFDSANRVIPTDICGFDASLQLYTKDGYACARLYIKKSFTNWKEKFANSWVGFYLSEEDLDRSYEHYQWVSNFEKAGKDKDDKDYLIYQYQSPVSIKPGVQARFIFSKEAVRNRYLLMWYSPDVKARTVPWEKAVTQ
ncbi:hypothetical protein NFI96_007895 [Prochilodus magdalenae]|nr:hypothetical protein NFI96_007895 [Prochilodus magdalenae]